jgi:hypothetical protein
MSIGLGEWKDIGKFRFGFTVANPGLVWLDSLRMGIYGTVTARI